MIAVTKAPVSNPIMRLVVSVARMLFIRSPATLFKATAICSMPNRKIASPPNNCIVMWNQLISPSSPAAKAGNTVSETADIRHRSARTVMRRSPNKASKTWPAEGLTGVRGPLAAMVFRLYDGDRHGCELDNPLGLGPEKQVRQAGSAAAPHDNHADRVSFRDLQNSRRRGMPLIRNFCRLWSAARSG